MKTESFTVPLIGGEIHLEVGLNGLTYESQLRREDGEAQELIRRLPPDEVERLAGLLGVESDGVLKQIRARWPDLMGLSRYMAEHQLGSSFVW